MTAEPPDTLDGARVLLWCRVPENAQGVRAAAICRYDGASGGLYLFYCDERWRVISDWSERDADDLKDTVRQHFGVVPDAWAVREENDVPET